MAAKKGMKISELKKQINEDDIKSLYLFYGEEEYLKDIYIERIKKKIPDGGFPEFNHLLLSGSLPMSEYDDAWESFPMMAEKKLIIIKDSAVANPRKGRSAESSAEDIKKFWLEKLERINPDTVVIFDEKSVDKRSVIYKEISRRGTVVEFDYLSEAELVTHVISRCLKMGRKISKDTAYAVVTRVDSGLMNLEHELEKLFEYCPEEILKSDVEKVVSKSLQVIVFDLSDAILANNAAAAMRILNDVKAYSGDDAFGILYLLFANFEKILHVKLLDGKPAGEIAREIGAAPFIANKYIASAKRFDREALAEMVIRVAQTDSSIKEGRVDNWTALYSYVTECMYYQNKGRRN